MPPRPFMGKSFVAWTNYLRNKRNADSDPSDDAAFMAFGAVPALTSRCLAYFVPDVGGGSPGDTVLVANNDDYALIEFGYFDNTGNPIPIGSITTRSTLNGGTGDWLACVPVAVPVTVQVPAGASVGFAYSKQGNGVEIPAGQFQFLCQF
jgi:hypothetical protein